VVLGRSKVKIKEVMSEGLLDKLLGHKSIKPAGWDEFHKGQQQRLKQVKAASNATKQNVKIIPASGAHPTMAKYKNQDYVLGNNEIWYTAKGRPVTIALAAILNRALEQT